MQEVIVYRNPLEAALWSGSFPNLIPIGVGAIVGLIVVLIDDQHIKNLIGHRLHNSVARQIRDYSSLVVGAIVWVAVSWYLWI